MTYFLTSSPCIDGSGLINPENGMVDELKRELNWPCRTLFICSSPDDVERTEIHGYGMKNNFEHSGFDFMEYIILDRRNDKDAEELIAKADFIILAGGHVPTQNDYFKEIGLRALLKDFDGVLMGISAGTMNSADVVYVHPEQEGETKFTDKQRFRPGLGLTKTMVLPHYQMIKNDVLDGLRLFEDVAYADSVGREFYCLVDGSYLYGKDGREELRGEAYLIKDGVLKQISSEGDVVVLH